jgi:predicted oxidoreductase
MGKLGSSKLSANKMASLINSCMEMGVTTFDHADIYGNYTTEREFGDAMILSAIPQRRDADYHQMRDHKTMC